MPDLETSQYFLRCVTRKIHISGRGGAGGGDAIPSSPQFATRCSWFWAVGGPIYSHVNRNTMVEGRPGTDFTAPPVTILPGLDAETQILLVSMIGTPLSQREDLSHRIDGRSAIKVIHLFSPEWSL